MFSINYLSAIDGFGLKSDAKEGFERILGLYLTSWTVGLEQFDPTHLDQLPPLESGCVAFDLFKTEQYRPITCAVLKFISEHVAHWMKFKIILTLPSCVFIF